MADQDLTIAFTTTADNSGSDQTVVGIKSVERESQILDSNARLSDEEREARRSAAVAMQQQWAEQSKGITYGLATDYEAAAQRAANAAEIEAASQEAAGVRAERAAASAAVASAEKAAAEQSAAIKIEAALAAETAAAEAAAIADQALAEKKIANAAIRALTPRSRELSAAMSVANSPEAMNYLANPYVLATAAVVSLGVISHATFGQIADDMNAGTEAGSKFAEQNKTTANVISALGHPWDSIKNTTATYFSWVGDQYRYLGNEITQFYDDTIGKGEVSLMQKMAADAKRVISTREELAQETAAHAEYTKQCISDDLALKTSEDNLSRGREQRAGVDSGKSAANEIDRLVKTNALKDAQLIDAINTAQGLVDAAQEQLADQSITRSAEQTAALNKTISDGTKNLKSLNDKLGLQQEQESIDLINKQEAGQKTNNDNLNSKLTANAHELQTQIQRVVDQKNGDVTPITRQALATATGLVTNGVKTQADATALQNATLAFRQSSDATQAGLFASLTTLMTSNTAALTDAKSANTQIAAATTAVVEQTKTTLADIQTHQTNTVASIKSLAPTQADVTAISTAGTATAKAITDMGNAYLSALVSMKAVVTDLIQKVNLQKQQIDNLSARIR